MTEVPVSTLRPGRGRLTAIVLLGPLAGAISLAVAQVFFGTPAASTSEVGGMTAFFVVFSYIFGLVSAGLAAIVYWLVYPGLAGRSWLVLVCACLAIGAACGATGVALTMSAFEMRLAIAPAVIAMGAWMGAVALPLTALPFRRRPL